MGQNRVYVSLLAGKKGAEWAGTYDRTLLKQAIYGRTIYWLACSVPRMGEKYISARYSSPRSATDKQLKKAIKAYKERL